MLKVVGASWTQTRFSTFLIAAVAGLGLVTILFGEIPRDVYDGRYAATVFWSEKSGFRIEFWGQGNDPNTIRKGVARAYYRPDMLTTGWAVLEIETQAAYPDWVQTHAAGLLEGSLSWQLIYWHWQNTIENTCDGREDFCEQVEDFLENNTAIIRDKATEMAGEDPFWHQVNLFYSQLDGLEVGWRHAVKRSRQEDNVDIPHRDFLWLNIMSDFKDLETKMNSSKELNPHRQPLSFALLKLLPEKVSQFVMSHATAGYYSAMLRVQKRYKFGLHQVADPDAPLVPGHVMVFTSYPGSLHSQDDFYQIKGSSSSLVVAGTHLRNFNSYLWQLFDSTEEVLVGPRVLAANRLASTPEKWAEHISTNSSGTGNKQWVIVQQNNKTNNVSLWVVEQLPGLTHAKDMSSDLVENGFWMSYGSPIFDDIKELGGYINQEREDLTAARLLLQQGQENVSDLQSMLELMRTPDISLFGRGDLLAFEQIMNSSSHSSSFAPSHSSSSTTAPTTAPSTTTTHSGKLQKTPIDLGLYATNTHQHHFKGSFRDIFKKIIAAKKIKQELSENSSGNDDSDSGEDLKSEEDKQIIKVSMKNRTMLQLQQKQLHFFKSVKPSFAHLKDIVGLIDFKITQGQGETFFAAAGPLYSSSKGPIVIEPFQWSKSPIKDLPHNGQSDVWKFNPVEPNWVWTKPIKKLQ